MFSAPIPPWAFYAVIAYFFIFMVVIGGLFIWWAKSRKERPPEKFKLLRGPGETQRRRVQKADEDMLTHFAGAAFVPLFVAWLILIVAARLPRTFSLPAAVVAAISFVIALIVSARKLLQFLRRRRDDLLGYLGERAVAEQLDDLRSHGFRIFHDVPAEGRAKKFNIDSVVVGPSGVTAVEVKTRRKKKGLPDRKDHVVEYDGQRLIWPWGEDRCGIDQLQNEAEWLREFIHGRTGLTVYPKAILALPGWYVTERVVGNFRVTNHKMLPAIVRDWRPESLTDQQIDLICRQLDERCRDVED
jgi:hypothetical protein